MNDVKFIVRNSFSCNKSKNSRSVDKHLIDGCQRYL